MAERPKIAGSISALKLNEDELADDTECQSSRATEALDDPPRELCPFCSTLTVRKIIGRASNRLGFTLRKTFAETLRSSSSCRLCRVLIKTIVDENPGVQLPESNRFHLQPHGRNRRRKHEQLYAVSVHLVSGADDSKTDRRHLPEIQAGTLSLYTEDDSAASDVASPAGPIGGRAVREASDLQTLKLWLDHCTSKHVTTCSSNSLFHKRSLVFLDDGYEQRLLPTRTLFVGHDASDSHVYLQEHRDGTRAHYVALSYCWGVDQHIIMTTSATIEKHKSGIPISTLPQTFQDAIKLTRGLGIQHLWIDALCILQDSKADWDHEASCMGALYAGAHLTIAALSAASASGGLFFDRGLTSEVVELPLGGSGNESTVKVYLRSCPSTSTLPKMLEEEAHSKRAWTLQERLLSPRVLYCAELQYYWECREMKRVEDGSKFPEGIMQIKEQRPQSLIGSLAKARPRAALDLWYEVVQTYSWRSLTFAKDKLTALDGLFKTFEPYTKSTYQYGIWMEDLAQGLAWRRSRRCPELVRQSDAKAPSWSWASRAGGLNHLNQRVYSNCPPPAWQSMLNQFSVGRQSEVAPGLVPSGSIASDPVCLRILGTIITKHTTSLKDLLDVRSTIYVDEHEDHTKDIACVTGLLSCLILAIVPSDSRRAHGLLLREIAPGIQERFGLVDIRDYQPLANRAEIKTVFII